MPLHSQQGSKGGTREMKKEGLREGGGQLNMRFGELTKRLGQLGVSNAQGRKPESIKNCWDF